MTAEKEFLAWCGTLFNEDPASLRMDSTREEVEGWDSMGVLLLMADLDELHGIQVGEEELAGLKTLGDIAALIEARGRKDG